MRQNHLLLLLLLALVCVANAGVVDVEKQLVSHTTLTESSGSAGSSSSINDDGVLCPGNTSCIKLWTIAPAAWSPGKAIKITMLGYLPVMAPSPQQYNYIYSSFALYDGSGTSGSQIGSVMTETLTMYSSRTFIAGEAGSVTLEYSFPTSADGTAVATFELVDSQACSPGISFITEDAATTRVTPNLATRLNCSYVVAPQGWNETMSILIWFHGITDSTISVEVYDGPTRSDRLVKKFGGSLGNVVVEGPAVFVFVDTTTTQLQIDRKLEISHQLIARRGPNCAALNWCSGHGTCIGDGFCECEPTYTATPNCGSFCTSGCVFGTCTGSTCACFPGYSGTTCTVGQLLPGGVSALTEPNGTVSLIATTYQDYINSAAVAQIAPEGWTPDLDIAIQVEELVSSYLYFDIGNGNTQITTTMTFSANLPFVTYRAMHQTATSRIAFSWWLQPRSTNIYEGVTVVTETSGTIQKQGPIFFDNAPVGWLFRPANATPFSKIDLTITSLVSPSYPWGLYNVEGSSRLTSKLLSSSPVYPATFSNLTAGATFLVNQYAYSSTSISFDFALNTLNDCSDRDFCSGHGSCTETGTCDCDAGYSDDNCTTLSLPSCLNGGTPLPSGCLCPADWIGPSCEFASPCPQNESFITSSSWNVTVVPPGNFDFSCTWILAPEVNAFSGIVLSAKCPSGLCNDPVFYDGQVASLWPAGTVPANGENSTGRRGPLLLIASFSSVDQAIELNYQIAPTIPVCDYRFTEIFSADSGAVRATTSTGQCKWLIVPTSALKDPATIVLHFPLIVPNVNVYLYSGDTLGQYSYIGGSQSNLTDVEVRLSSKQVLVAVSFSNTAFEFDYSLDPVSCNCTHGTCSSSGGVCECFAGWTGDSCDQPRCDGGCFHGTCTGPNLCTCDAGWAGQRCDSSDFCGKLDFVASTASGGSFHTSGTPPASSWTCVWRIEHNTTSSEEAEMVIEFRGLFFDLVCNASNVFEVSAGTATAAPLLRKGCFNTTRQTDPVYADEWPLVITASSVDSVGGFGGSFSLVPRSSAPHMTCHGVKVLSGSNGSISASKMQAETSCSWIIFSDTQTVTGGSVLGIAVPRMTGGILTVHDGPGSFAPIISVFDQAPFVVNSTSAGKSLFVVWTTIDSDATDFLAFEWGLDVEHPALFSEDEETDESSMCPQGCVNGTCLPTGVCVCRTGWEGANCSTPICKCMPSGAVCTGPDQYQCPPDRTGKFCVPDICPEPIILSTALGEFLWDPPIHRFHSQEYPECEFIIESHDGNPVVLRPRIIGEGYANAYVFDGNTTSDKLLLGPRYYYGDNAQYAYSELPTVYGSKTVMTLLVRIFVLRPLMLLELGTFIRETECCNGHGFVNGSSICECDFGWIGPNCTTYLCNGTSTDMHRYCSWHGTCDNKNEVCRCDIGWSGRYCSQQSNCPVEALVTAPDTGSISSILNSMYTYETWWCNWTIAPTGLVAGKKLMLELASFSAAYMSYGIELSLSALDGRKFYSLPSGSILSSGKRVISEGPVVVNFRNSYPGMMTGDRVGFSLLYEVFSPDDDSTATSCTLLNNCSGHGVCNSQGTCSCLDGFSGADCSVCPSCEHGTCKDGACNCFDGWSGDACDVRASCAGVQSLTALSGEIAFSSVPVSSNEPEACSWVIQPFWWAQGCVLRLRVTSIFSNSTVLSVSDGANMLGSGQPLDPISFANRSQDQVVIESITGKMIIDAAFANELEGFEASFCVVFNGECIEEPPVFSSSTSAIISSSMAFSDPLRVSSSTPGSNALLLALAIGIPALAVLIAIIVASACLAHRYFTTHEDAVEMAEINKLVKCSPESIDFSHNGKDLCRVGEAAACPFTLANLTDKRFTIEFKPRPSHKWEMTFDPPTLTLEPNEESAAATCQLKLLCTTVMSGVGVPMHVQGNEIGQLWVSAEGALSAMLDRDEIVLDRALGSGSFATVHTATWRGTTVAVKVFREHLFDIRDLAGDVRREVDLCMNLRHPNIIQYFGAAISKTTACIVMELATNGSLGDAIKEHKLTVAAKFRMAHDVASGMLFLHTSHVIHRDLKPDNVLLMSTDPNAPVCGKLSDFGTSRTIGSADSARTYTKGVGTPVFCAPEVLDGQKYSSAADVYSFSLLLWNLFSEVIPFSHIESNYAMLKGVMEGKRPPMVDNIPEEIRSMIEGTWSHVPEERAEFAAIVPDLEQIMTANGTMPAHMTQQAASRHASSAGTRTSTKGRTKSRKPSPTSTATAIGEVPPPPPPPQP